MLSLKKYNDGYIDQDGCFWEDKYSWFYSGILGFCGCGCDNQKLLTIFLSFNLITDYGAYRFDPEAIRKFDSDYLDLALHIFDKEQLTEHGSSVYGSWLEQKGLDIYKILTNMD